MVADLPAVRVHQGLPTLRRWAFRRLANYFPSPDIAAAARKPVPDWVPWTETSPCWPGRLIGSRYGWTRDDGVLIGKGFWYRQPQTSCYWIWCLVQLSLSCMSQVNSLAVSLVLLGLILQQSRPSGANGTWQQSLPKCCYVHQGISSQLEHQSSHPGAGAS